MRAVAGGRANNACSLTPKRADACKHTRSARAPDELVLCCKELQGSDKEEQAKPGEDAGTGRRV